MSTSTAVWSAVISAAVSLAVVVLAQVWTGRRERGVRTYDRRRDALTGAQDAALAVRNALADYGPLARTGRGTESPELSEAGRRVEETFAGFEVALTRVDEDEVLAAVRRWLQLVRFHYISTEEVTVGEESLAWTAMNERFGVALRSDDAQVSDAPPPGSAG